MTCAYGCKPPKSTCPPPKSTCPPSLSFLTVSPPSFSSAKLLLAESWKEETKKKRKKKEKEKKLKRRRYQGKCLSKPYALGFFWWSFNYKSIIMRISWHFHGRNGHKANGWFYLRCYLTWKKFYWKSYSFTHACFLVSFFH